MKRFVNVEVIFDTNGNIYPRLIIWDGTRSFPITDVTDVRMVRDSGSLSGITRYTCVIAGKTRQLFFDSPRWYVIQKGADPQRSTP